MNERPDARELYEAMPKESACCALCGSDKAEPLFLTDRFGMGLRTVRCSCGFVFTNPRPTADEMRRFYRDSYRAFYTGSADPEKDHEMDSPVTLRAKRLADWVLPELKGAAAKDPLILDYGCGAGVLLSIFRHRIPDSRLRGIEPDETFARHAAFETDAEILSDISGGPYDLIILNHVLEHLHDPVGELKKLAAHLKPSGLMLVEVPNAVSPKWARPVDMLHIAHLNHFTPRTLESAAALAGLETVKFTEENPRPEPWAMSYLFTKTSRAARRSRGTDGDLETFRSMQRKMERQALAENTGRRTLGPLFAPAKKAVTLVQDRGWSGAAGLAALRAAAASGSSARDLSTPLVAPLRAASHEKNGRELLPMIKGRHVFIFGSGPSARGRHDIPDDALVFTCNRGLKLFGTGRIERKVDLYLCTWGKVERLRIGERLNPGTQIRYFLTDNTRAAQSDPSFSRITENVRFDDGMDAYYLSRVLPATPLSTLRGRSRHPWTSTGVRLIQYALYYGASAITLAGIEFGRGGYFWGPTRDPWHHSDIDENFMKAAAELYPQLAEEQHASI